MWNKNVIFSGVDNSSSVCDDNKKKDVLVVGEGSTQGLDNTTIITKAKYPINSTQSGQKFVLSLHYNEAIVSYLLIQ